jgi:hypothetical protein
LSNMEESMNILLRHKIIIGVIVWLVVIVLLVACGRSKAKGSPLATSPPPEVEAVQVEEKDVPIYSAWVGTLA